MNRPQNFYCRNLLQYFHQFFFYCRIILDKIILCIDIFNNSSLFDIQYTNNSQLSFLVNKSIFNNSSYVALQP